MAEEQPDCGAADLSQPVAILDGSAISGLPVGLRLLQAPAASAILHSINDFNGPWPASTGATRTKRNRPFAKRRPVDPFGLGAMVVLLAVLWRVALFLPPLFMLVLVGYFDRHGRLIRCSLKRMLLIDVLTLAGLYAMRILAGGRGDGFGMVVLALLAFSIFLLPLALPPGEALRRACAAPNCLRGERIAGRGLPGRGPGDDRHGRHGGGLHLRARARLCSSTRATLSEEYTRPWLIWPLAPIILYIHHARVDPGPARRDAMTIRSSSSSATGAASWWPASARCCSSARGSDDGRDLSELRAGRAGRPGRGRIPGGRGDRTVADGRSRRQIAGRLRQWALLTATAATTRPATLVDMRSMNRNPRLRSRHRRAQGGSRRASVRYHRPRRAAWLVPRRRARHALRDAGRRDRQRHSRQRTTTGAAVSGVMSQPSPCCARTARSAIAARTANRRLYSGTIGGLGLTGLILTATIRLDEGGLGGRDREDRTLRHDRRLFSTAPKKPTRRTNMRWPGSTSWPAGAGC